MNTYEVTVPANFLAVVVADSAEQAKQLAIKEIMGAHAHNLSMRIAHDSVAAVPIDPPGDDLYTFGNS